MKIQKQENSNARYFAPRQIEMRNLQEEKKIRSCVSNKVSDRNEAVNHGKP